MKARILLAGALPFAMSAAAQTNCATATQVCNDVSFTGNSSGAGTQELNGTNQGCLGVEHQSSWYYFQPVTSGTVSLTIQTSVDYDFAIWATGNCSSLGAPVRCSYSGSSGNTGLAAMTPGTSSGCGFFGLFPCPPSAVTDVSEGAGGDKWVMPLPVVAGQTYIMLIDNFTANSTPFTLDWTFSGGASLNCAPVVLPIELLNLIAAYDAVSNANKIRWSTASERLNDHFTIERSTDAASWTIIGKQDGSMESLTQIDYVFDDYNFEPGKKNYYRLSQTDYDGTTETFDVQVVDNTTATKTVVKVFNSIGQEVPFETTGLVILLYEDGTTQRFYR